MTFTAFQSKISEIAAEFNPSFRPGIAMEAYDHLRGAIGARLDVHPTVLHYYTAWTEAEDADFAAALAVLDQQFRVTTTERPQVRAMFKGATILARPSAIWLEGKAYRAKLIDMETFDTSEGLKFRAKMTDFCKVAIWGWRSPDTKKKLTIENASEYAAQKSMRVLFETHFGVKLDQA